VGPTRFGVAAVCGLFFVGVFEVVLFTGCRGPVLAESGIGRCAEAAEAQRSQASDAKTTLVATGRQA
jgi:hypothetical protein